MDFIIKNYKMTTFIVGVLIFLITFSNYANSLLCKTFKGIQQNPLKFNIFLLI